VLAAGLGKLSVLSTLGQPLKAEIEIVSLQRGEGDTLGARLAPAEVFRQANVDLNPALMSVKFAVQRRAGGQYVMSLTSPKPLNEPFVDMLVELNWANGRLVREYTFLLDPPEYAGPKRSGAAQAAAPALVVPAEQAVPQATAPAEPPPPLQAAPAEPAAVIAAVPLGPNVPGQTAQPEPIAAAAPSAPGAEPAPSEGQVEVMPVQARPDEPVPAPVEARRAEPVPAPAESAPAAPGELVQEPGIKSTYEVVRGDTLSKIAIRNQAEGITLQQMLVALFRTNPDAFVADNMNRLRAGKIISIPDRDAAESIAPADARRIVTAQYADFNDYRRSLGIAVASASAPQGGARQASGAISPPKEAKAAAPKEPPKDELRLSRADDAKRGAKGAGAAAADDLAAKDNALKEANERIALLEKNLQDLQKLVEVKSKAATQLQQQAEAAKAAPAQKAEPAKGAPAAKVEPSKAPEPAKVAPKAPEATKAPEAAKAPEPAKAAAVVKAPEGPAAAKTPEPAKAPEAAKSAEAAKAPEPAKAPEAPKAPEPAKSEGAKAAPKKAPAAPQVEVSFIDDLLDNPMALGGAGGAVILLAGYAAYAWRRKRSAQFENSIMSVVPSDADSVLGSVGGRNVDTSSSSIQSDLGPGAGKAGGEEIDPIAEADVYMAYGRDAQAEEILKDALAKDSSRQAIRVKLLEIYANRKDTRAFEAAANELHTATGGRGADWEKAAALGLSIDPTKALYGGKPASSFTAAPSQLPPGFNETAQMPAFNPPTTAAPALESEAPLNIDFDIGAATTAGAAPLPDLDLGLASAPSAGPAAGLDFDLGLGGDKTGATLAGAAPASAAAEPPLSIDFDLPMGDKPAQAAPAAPVAAPVTELAAIDFNLGTQASGESKTEAPKALAVDLASISLDLTAPGGGNGSGGAPDSRWQEVATKLDLAKAYEEMGDKDGARELLKEVVKEGDTAQQQQAQTMLQALG
jgi:pilus assembly protein FimV